MASAGLLDLNPGLGWKGGQAGQVAWPLCASVSSSVNPGDRAPEILLGQTLPSWLQQNVYGRAPWALLDPHTAPGGPPTSSLPAAHQPRRLPDHHGSFCSSSLRQASLSDRATGALQSVHVRTHCLPLPASPQDPTALLPRAQVPVHASVCPCAAPEPLRLLHLGPAQLSDSCPHTPRTASGQRGRNHKPANRLPVPSAPGHQPRLAHRETPPQVHSLCLS